MGLGLQWGKIDGRSPNLSQRRVKTLLNSSRADALPNQPASLSLIFYLASSSDLSSSAHRTLSLHSLSAHKSGPIEPGLPQCAGSSLLTELNSYLVLLLEW